MSWEKPAHNKQFGAMAGAPRWKALQNSKLSGSWQVKDFFQPQSAQYPILMLLPWFFPVVLSKYSRFHILLRSF